MKKASVFTRLSLLAVPSAIAVLLCPSANATSLSIGADYLLRGVATTPHDLSVKDQRYYDQRIEAYLTSDLSQDVEATLRLQSITPWGLEGSTTPLVTRYPNANGNVFVQNAFVRLPKIWNNRIILTAGRQPIQWGDGHILSDDDLGFDAIRLQVRSPFESLPFELDGFTAKISEGLSTGKDSDLHGVMLSYERNLVKWEFMGLFENDKTTQNYELGAETSTVTATQIKRRIFGVRAQTDLKDAYLKGEYYIQNGNIAGDREVKLGGEAYSIGMGAKANTLKFGRFGAAADYLVGSGDDVNTPGKDESFRPTFASRWSGLERTGYGHYFASTFSDVVSSTFPFSPASSTNSGLPGGTSGIQTIHFGLESTPFPKWTFSLDYYQYKAQKNITGPKDLGTEFDYGFIFHYSGLVTVTGNSSVFNPGAAFPDGSQKTAKYSTIEVGLKF